MAKNKTPQIIQIFRCSMFCTYGGNHAVISFQRLLRSLTLDNVQAVSLGYEKYLLSSVLLMIKED